MDFTFSRNSIFTIFTSPFDLFEIYFHIFDYGFKDYILTIPTRRGKADLFQGILFEKVVFMFDFDF